MSAASGGATLEFTLGHRPAPARKRIAADVASPARAGRIPRVAKLLALAIRWEGQLREGEMKNCAALARAGQVSRARLSQIMSLLELAPAIQEDLLFMTCPCGSADPIRERTLRRVTKLVRWDQQQLRYEELRRGGRNDQPDHQVS